MTLISQGHFFIWIRFLELEDETDHSFVSAHGKASDNILSSNYIRIEKKVH